MLLFVLCLCVYVFMLVFVFPVNVSVQCSMCKMLSAQICTAVYFDKYQLMRAITFYCIIIAPVRNINGPKFKVCVYVYV